MGDSYPGGTDICGCLGRRDTFRPFGEWTPPTSYSRSSWGLAPMCNPMATPGLDLLLSTSGGTSTLAAQFIAQQLGEVGIDVIVDSLDQSAYTGKYASGSFDVDQAIAAQRRTTDVTTRQAGWAKAWNVWSDDLPYAYLLPPSRLRHHRRRPAPRQPRRAERRDAPCDQPADPLLDAGTGELRLQVGRLRGSADLGAGRPANPTTTHTRARPKGGRTLAVSPSMSMASAMYQRHGDTQVRASREPVDCDSV